MRVRIDATDILTIVKGLVPAALLGASYYKPLDTSNSSAAPFADDCIRRENGMRTTGNPPPKAPGFATMGAMGCASELNTRAVSCVTAIEPRRVDIAEIETGWRSDFCSFAGR